jgi:hypothetical protein
MTRVFRFASALLFLPVVGGALLVSSRPTVIPVPVPLRALADEVPSLGSASQLRPVW